MGLWLDMWRVALINAFTSTHDALKLNGTVTSHFVAQVSQLLSQMLVFLDDCMTHMHCKAPSTPATMSKQHCRMLQVERFFRQSRNKLNMFNLCRLCRKNEISRKSRSTSLPFLAAKSNFASILLLG